MKIITLILRLCAEPTNLWQDIDAEICQQRPVLGPLKYVSKRVTLRASDGFEAGRGWGAALLHKHS